MNNLVIVESPTKARTLSRFLGSKFQIEASMGHVRDLPKAELGVDIEHNFEPKYIIPRDKKKRVNELTKIVNLAKNIWLATDPDREGEAIAWHISELLSNSEIKNQKSKIKNGVEESGDQRLSESVRIKRVVFHEITEGAVKEAFEHPRDLDYKLIDAQQARRVLDRLVGYKLSPLLWKKVKRGLSAGRVQTVALRLIVEREREINAFKPLEYWSIEGEFETHGRGKFFGLLTKLYDKKLEIKSELDAKTHLRNLDGASYKIAKIEQKEVKRHPSPPFSTSTLQQTAGNKLGFSAKKTMMLAQNLYEHGLITYMRTDSLNLAPSALSETRALIEKEFGKQYLPASSKVYKSRSKNIQEAHEAIRPTNIGVHSSQLTVQAGLNRDHGRLYDLIWKRMVASQMKEAILDQVSVDVEALPTGPVSSVSKDSYIFHSTGSTIKFDGWLKVYGIVQLEEEEEGEARKQVLPNLEEGESLNLLKLTPEQHFTQPPPRYTEAALIKKLEELGIGRPSTYAPIISTIQERFYVERSERKFFPTDLGIAACDFLIKYFPDVFDYAFTAQMEDKLDDISRGELKWKETIRHFFEPFEKKLEGVFEKAEHVKLELEEVDKNCPLCGKKLVVRIGKFGKFLACSGFPECKHTQSFEEKINAKCPDDGGEIVIRKTRKGKTFYGCKNWPNCKFASWTKPKQSAP